MRSLFNVCSGWLAICEAFSAGGGFIPPLRGKDPQRHTNRLSCDAPVRRKTAWLDSFNVPESGKWSSLLLAEFPGSRTFQGGGAPKATGQAGAGFC